LYKYNISRVFEVFIEIFSSISLELSLKYTLKEVLSPHCLHQILCANHFDDPFHILHKKTKPQLSCGFFYALAQQIVGSMVPFDRSKGMLRQA